ncbi:MAG: hypothetical protein A2942_00905 [Candidatus Lloydbacteria bacterium RIFCSPLOWO2_01_FULL_50_20]|uniref:Uncharacterized protein n=1 Tax=Candidatus Lloydbacteria bacterium RIFCSPLOWO2_01_FULL_50_20 TaxID=1798665 RepID=A0A1G2DHF9_9BACT|nr:MAG: hypothetical protein A2942_00905 [Candidatus Lloydbacteria bacterium RIFCSPLOWO2_01_FULL_50_20]
MAASRGPRKSSLNVVAETPAKSSASDSGVGSSSDILARIRSGESRLGEAGVSDRTRQKVDLSIDLAEQVGQAHKLENEKVRDLAGEILTAKLSELREKLPENQKVLAELLKSLEEECNKIGGGFENFEKHSTDEEALMAKAKSLLARCEAALEHAKNDWYLIPGNKERAIAKAQSDRDAAQAGVAQSIEQAKIARTKRLLNADFSDMFARFNARIEQTLVLLDTSQRATVKEYNQVQVEKVRAFKQKTEAAVAMEELRPQVAEAIAKLQQDETIRDGLEIGTKERSEAEEAVSNQKKKVETLQGYLNQALALFQAKERATTELEVNEQTLLGQSNAYDVAIASLRANSETWRVTFKNRLAIMKAMAGLEASEKQDRVGAAISQENTEQSAKAFVASVDAVISMLEKHPERLKDLEQVRGIQRKGIEDAMKRMNDLYAATMDRGGDKEDSSYGASLESSEGGSSSKG